MERNHTGQYSNSNSTIPVLINNKGTSGIYEQTLMPVKLDPITLDFEKDRNSIVIIELPKIEFQEIETRRIPESTKVMFGGNESNFKDLYFLRDLKEMEATQELKAIDVLYKHINPLLESEAYFRVDTICSFFRLFKFKLKLVVSLLTITHSKKEVLVSRPSLLEYAKEAGKEEGLSTSQIDSILKGF